MSTGNYIRLNVRKANETSRRVSHIVETGICGTPNGNRPRSVTPTSRLRGTNSAGGCRGIRRVTLARIRIPPCYFPGHGAWVHAQVHKDAVSRVSWGGILETRGHGVSSCRSGIAASIVACRCCWSRASRGRTTIRALFTGNASAITSNTENRQATKNH